MIPDNIIWKYDRRADACPVCHSFITPNEVHKERKSNLDARIIYRCTNSNCKELFIAYYEHSTRDLINHFKESKPMSFIKHRFDQEILDVSKEFVEIYNQSLKAESDWLDKIAGVWFRKSLEFLIKDYLVLLNPDEEEVIKTQFLTKVIKDRLDDEEIKAIAERAVWLWNDETHYVKEWTTHDINDLKNLIDIVQTYISKKQKTKKYLESMESKRPSWKQ